MEQRNVAAGLYLWPGKNQGGSADWWEGRTCGGPRATRPWRGKAVAASLAVLLVACAAPRLEFLGAPAQPVLTLADAGLQLTLVPNTWNGYPADLSRYYTPLQIGIQNDRSDEIQVRYEDFVAVDEIQNQYRAVAPAEVVRGLFGRGAELGAAEAGPLLAFDGPWRPYYRWPHHRWPYSPWYPYGPYGPFAWPAPYPYDYYPWPQGTGYDILARALREGRILPGARIEGFLYLQLATQRASTLTVSWTPTDPAGQPLATLRSQFRVLR
jgi:hypothetical protein